MKALRRLLGILVMFAGILGMLLSVAGLVGVWMVRPTIASVVDSTIVTLNSSISTSQKAMQITGEALGATVDSVDALSVMLGATAVSVQDTKPVLDDLNSFMGEKLPTTMESAIGSIETAQQGAVVLDAAIKSLDTFRVLMSAVPLVGGFVEQPAQPYNPKNSLAESLGELAADLDDLPMMFTDMSVNLAKADDNLDTIQISLITMADSSRAISNSLTEYESIIAESQSSMANLAAMLTNIQNNLTPILNGAATVFTLSFLWLLAAQVVIFSQGWELYHGTAGRLENSETQTPEAA